MLRRTKQSSATLVFDSSILLRGELAKKLHLNKIDAAETNVALSSTGAIRRIGVTGIPDGLLKIAAELIARPLFNISPRFLSFCILQS